MPKPELPLFKALRERAGLSIEDAAALIDVSMRSAYRYEGGKHPRKAVKAHSRRPATKRAGKRAKPYDFTFIDLFAGIGGLRGPFEKEAKDQSCAPSSNRMKKWIQNTSSRNICGIT
jgi:hypothetical protein